MPELTCVAVANPMTVAKCPMEEEAMQLTVRLDLNHMQESIQSELPLSPPCGSGFPSIGFRATKSNLWFDSLWPEDFLA